MIYMLSFTNEIGTFFNGRFVGNRAKELYSVNTEMNFPVYWSLDFEEA